MYGDTSEPQLLQTTKRSGPLDMWELILRRRLAPTGRVETELARYAVVPSTISPMTSRMSWLAS